MVDVSCLSHEDETEVRNWFKSAQKGETNQLKSVKQKMKCLVAQ